MLNNDSFILFLIVNENKRLEDLKIKITKSASNRTRFESNLQFYFTKVF